MLCIVCVYIYICFNNTGDLSLWAQSLVTHNDVSEEWDFEEARQFDFWIGEWDVNVRTIRPDNTWADWKRSKANIYSILDGRAILELWEDQHNGAPMSVIIGYSLRYYDSQSGKWILWLNWPSVNTSGSSSLTGKFRHNRGEFFGRRPLNDSISLLSRYTFSDISPTSLRWDDAFSKDGGKTWTNSWIMEFSRIAEKPEEPKGNTLHTYRNGNRCTNDEFIQLKKLIGNWSGTVKRKNENWKEEEIYIENYQVLGGCSVMSFLEIKKEKQESFKEFGLFTFNTFAKMYEVGILDNSPSSSYHASYGNFTNEQLQLSRTNQEDGSIEETHVLIFESGDTLKMEKWIYEGDQKVKVLEATLALN